VTLARLWAFLAVGLPVLASLIGNLSAVDLAYHLRAGEMTLDTGRIPMTDTFTFTAAGAPWLNQQWGAQVILAAVFRLAGWTGLVVLRAGLIGLTFGLLFEACRRRGIDLRRAAWLTLAAFIVSAVALALRPQLFGMALLALTLVLVADRRAHPRRLWAVPFIVLVWANIHGSFFLGPVVLGLAWLEDVYDGVPSRHRTLALAGVSAAAALVNPFGVGVWAYAAGLSTNSFVTSRISEWQPTTLRTIPGILFFGSAALVTLLLARRGRATTWPTVLWIGVFFAIGAYAIRGVAWWPLGAAVAVAGILAAAPVAGPAPSGAAEAAVAPVRRARSSPINLVIVGLIVVVCIALLPIWRPVDPRVGAPAGIVGDAPPGITASLRDLTRPGDRILNPQPWGSWFELALPETLVAIDSRIEIFPADVWTDYDVIRSGGPRWQETLARQDPRWIVATDDADDFVSRLQAAGWHDAYRDDDGTILGAP
jgi:hypothetical protein